VEGLIVRLQRFCIGIVLVSLLCSLSVQTGTAYSSIKTFDTSIVEWPVKIISSSDGGFAIAGTTYNRRYDFLLIKTDEYGRMNWIHTYGGEHSEFCNSFTECADGGFALVGRIPSSSDDSAWIVRTNSYGVHLWNLTIFEDEDTDSPELLDIIELPSGEIFAAGHIRNRLLNHTDAWLVNIDANGTLKWSKTYGEIYQHQLCKSLILCHNGDLLMAGDTANSVDNLKDFWMIRINSSGVLIWQKTYNRVGNEDFSSVIETYDGGFALTGVWEKDWYWSESERMFLLRTDSTGNLMWNRTYSGSEVDIGSNEVRQHESTTGRDMVECDDRGFAIVGATRIFANYFPKNIWLLRTDELGNPKWNYTIERNWRDSPVSMVKRENTGFAIVAGTRESDTLSEYDSEHDILLAILEDETPYTPPTTTTTPSSNGILPQAIMVAGASAVVLVILYYRYKRR
jgi:hypothetical protein